MDTKRIEKKKKKKKKSICTAHKNKKLPFSLPMD